MSVFKAYDVRGLYPQEIDENLAYKIGRASVIFLEAKRVLVGMDMRSHSPGLKEALVRGITDEGADVVDIGLCSTPMFYWATQEYEAGIMVTASHNPSQYNGFKICRDGAIPVGGPSGLKEIESIVKKDEFVDRDVKGEIEEIDVLDDFIDFSKSFLKTDKHFKVVIDAANGMGGYTYGRLKEKLPDTIELIPMFFELDGSFPNHEANPLKPELLGDLMKAVKEKGANFGVSLDGDGDRISFIDDKGEYIPNDITLAILSRQVLSEKPGAKILYDIRSSRVVPEEIEAAGGEAIMTRVGHAFIKHAMRDEGAAFAGELSGHFYNSEQQNTENTIIVLARMMNLLAKKGESLSEVTDSLKRYSKINETNFEVKDAQEAIQWFKTNYTTEDSQVSEIDGIRIDYEDWWLSIRSSNTEPLLRLNMEAKTSSKLKENLDRVERDIQRFTK